MKIAIIGTGVMGRGWITQCAMTGNEVHCFDANHEILAGTIPFCEKLAGSVARRFKIADPDFSTRTAGNITTHTDQADFMDAARDCAVFLEVIFEDLKLKCNVLGDLLPQLPENVIFWSNTSSLDIDKMGEAGGRPERSIVTHGMNPVPLMPGVEVVPGAKTDGIAGHEKSPVSGSQYPGVLGQPIARSPDAGRRASARAGQDPDRRR